MGEREVREKKWHELVLLLLARFEKDIMYAQHILLLVKNLSGEEAAEQTILKLKEARLWLEEVGAEKVLPPRETLKEEESS
jgi:hypothetical protein